MNFALGTDFGATLADAVGTLDLIATHAMSNDRALQLVVGALETVFATVPLPPDALDAARRVHRESLSLARTLADSADPWLAAQDAYKRQHAARSALDAALAPHTAPANVAATETDAADYASLFGDTPRTRGDIGTAAAEGDYDLLMAMLNGEFATVVHQRRRHAPPASAADEKLTTPAPEKRVRFERPPLSGGTAPPVAAVTAAAGRPSDAVAVVSPDAGSDIGRWLRELLASADLRRRQATLWVGRLFTSDYEIGTMLRLERIAVIDGRLRRLAPLEPRAAVLLMQEGLRNDTQLAELDRVAVAKLDAIREANVRRDVLRAALRALPDEAQLAPIVADYRASLIAEKSAVEDEQQIAVGRPSKRQVPAPVAESLSRLVGGDTTDPVRVVRAEAVGDTIAQQVPLAQTSIDERSSALAASAATAAPSVTRDSVTLASGWVGGVRTVFSDAPELDQGLIYTRENGEWRGEYPSMLPERRRDLLDDPALWRAGFRADLAPFDVISYFSNPLIAQDDKVRDWPLLVQYVNGVGILRSDVERYAETVLPNGYRVAQTFADRVTRALGSAPSALLAAVVEDVRPAYERAQRDVAAVLDGAPLDALPSEALRTRVLDAIDVVTEQMWACALDQEHLDASWFGQARQSYELERAANGALPIEPPPADLFNVNELGFNRQLTPDQRKALLEYWQSKAVQEVRTAQRALDEAVVPRAARNIERLRVAGQGTPAFVTRQRSITGASVAKLIDVPGVRDAVVNIDFVQVDRQGAPSRVPVRFDASDPIGLYRQRITLVRDLCDGMRVNEPRCNRWRIVDDVARIDRRNTSDALIIDYNQQTVMSLRLYDPTRNTVTAALHQQTLRAATAAGGAVLAITQTALPLAEERPIGPYLAEQLTKQDVGGASWFDLAYTERLENWSSTVGTARAVYANDTHLHRNFTMAFVTAETLAYWLDVVSRLVGVGANYFAPRLAERLALFGTNLRTSWVATAATSAVAFASSVARGSGAATKRLNDLREDLVDALRRQSNVFARSEYTAAAAFAELAASGVDVGLAGSLRILTLLPSLIGQLLGVFGVLRAGGTGNIASQIINGFMYVTTLAMLAWVAPAIAANLRTFLSAALYAGCVRAAARSGAELVREAVIAGTTQWRRSGERELVKRREKIFEALLLVGTVGAGALGSAVAAYFLPSEWTPISVWNAPLDATTGEQRLLEMVTYAGTAYARVVGADVISSATSAAAAALGPRGLWRLFVDMWQPAVRATQSPAAQAAFNDSVINSFAVDVYQQLEERLVQEGPLFNREFEGLTPKTKVWREVIQMAVDVRDGHFHAIENDAYFSLREIGINLLSEVTKPSTHQELTVVDRALVARIQGNALLDSDNRTLAYALMATGELFQVRVIRACLSPPGVEVDTGTLLSEVVARYVESRSE